MELLGEVDGVEQLREPGANGGGSLEQELPVNGIELLGEQPGADRVELLGEEPESDGGMSLKEGLLGGGLGTDRELSSNAP